MNREERVSVTITRVLHADGQYSVSVRRDEGPTSYALGTHRIREERDANAWGLSHAKDELEWKPADEDTAA